MLLDPRMGSGELLPSLQRAGVEVVVTPLEFGDLCFNGVGREGRTLAIGVERKKVPDLVSCLYSKRFSGYQLPGLLRTYDMAFLVVEGAYRPNPDSGQLEILGRGGWCPFTFHGRTMDYATLENHMSTLQTQAVEQWGRYLHVRQTGSPMHTCWFSAALHRWAQKADHGSHVGLYVPQPVLVVGEPSLCRKVASQLPGIGWEKSGRVEEALRTVEGMVKAEVKDWRGVEGIGPVLAKKAWGALRGVE